MRRLVICWAVAVSLLFSVSPRLALADCTDSTDCDPAETADGPTTVPPIDESGVPIPFVEEVDAPPPGPALVDGNLY